MHPNDRQLQSDGRWKLEFCRFELVYFPSQFILFIILFITLFITIIYYCKIALVVKMKLIAFEIQTVEKILERNEN